MKRELSSKMTEGLKGIARFILILYTPKKSLRLAYGNPPPFTREAESLRLAYGNSPPFTREAMAQMTEGFI